MGGARISLGVPSKINGKRNPEYARLQKLRWKAENPAKWRALKQRENKRYSEKYPEKRREAQRKWCLEHPDKLRERQEQQRAERLRRKTVIYRHKQLRGCVDCGIRDPRVLDYDHVPERGPKLFTIGSSNRSGSEELKAEIAKCEVRCANCHRIMTLFRRAA